MGNDQGSKRKAAEAVDPLELIDPRAEGSTPDGDVVGAIVTLDEDDTANDLICQQEWDDPEWGLHNDAVLGEVDVRDDHLGWMQGRENEID